MSRGLDPTTPYKRVYVLRLGHRPGRDKRVTSHAALVARAFGANGFLLANVCDASVERTVKRVTECWGGAGFYYECNVQPKHVVKQWRSRGGEVIHLTMYGVPIDNIIDEIRMSPRDKLIIIGAEKVERFYYENSDYNVAIGSQPHSEIAALAVFLDRLFRGRELRIIYEDAKARIIPQSHGKKVVGSGQC